MWVRNIVTPSSPDAILQTPNAFNNKTVPAGASSISTATSASIGSPPTTAALVSNKEQDPDVIRMTVQQFKLGKLYTRFGCISHCSTSNSGAKSNGGL